MAIQTMTPKERYKTTMAGGKPDKLPIYMGNHAQLIAAHYGITIEQYCNDVALNVDFSCRFFEEFGFEQVMGGVAYIFFGMGPEIGTKWEWVGVDNLPAAVDGPIKTRADLERFQIPKEPTGYFKKYIEINRRLKERLGDRRFLTAIIAGPFMSVNYLRGGVEHSLMDSKIDLPFYEACMRKGVELSIFLGQHMLALGLDNYILNDVFITPEMVSPDFYWDHIAPYNQQVIQHFAARGHRLSDMYGAFVGKKGDLASQRDGRIVYHYFRGTRESVESIKTGMKYALAGWPALCTISGRMMSTWSKDEILGFLKEALDYMVRDQGKYPAISLASVDPPTREDAPAHIEKLRAIVEFRDKYKL